MIWQQILILEVGGVYCSGIEYNKKYIVNSSETYENSFKILPHE